MGARSGAAYIDLKLILLSVEKGGSLLGSRRKPQNWRLHRNLNAGLGLVR